MGVVDVAGTVAAARMAEMVRAEPIALLADRVGEAERVVVHAVPERTRVLRTDARDGAERGVLSAGVVVAEHIAGAAGQQRRAVVHVGRAVQIVRTHHVFGRQRERRVHVLLQVAIDVQNAVVPNLGVRCIENPRQNLLGGQRTTLAHIDSDVWHV